MAGHDAGVAGDVSKIVDVDGSAVDEASLLELSIQCVVVDGDDQRRGLRLNPVDSLSRGRLCRRLESRRRARNRCCRRRLRQRLRVR